MIIKVSNALSAEDLESIQATLKTAEFVDGKLTAGWYAKQVKHNQQLPSSQSADLKATIKTALLRHPLFQATVYPNAFSSL